MTTSMWQTLLVRRIASFAFVALFVFGGFLFSSMVVLASVCTDAGGQCYSASRPPSPLSEYTKVDKATPCTLFVGTGTCYKPNAVNPNQCPHPCQGSCSADEKIFDGKTCPVSNPQQVCCTPNPRPACPIATTGFFCSTSRSCVKTTDSVHNEYKCDDVGFLSQYCCQENASKPACTALNPPGQCKNACATTDHSGDGKCSTGVCCVPNTASKPACTALNPPGQCKNACATTDHSGDGKCSTGVCCVPDGSTAGGGGSTTTSFTNPLQYNTVQDVLGSLLTTLQGIIVILSIVFIIIGALLYITSGGSESQIKTAKSAIFAAMIGLAIGIAAPSFLKEISNILGWGKDKLPDNVSSAVSLTTILTNVLNFLLGITGILALIMLIVGAIMFLSSAGDENKLDAGKKIVKASIIGIIVTFAALLIVKQIAALFVV